MLLITGASGYVGQSFLARRRSEVKAGGRQVRILPLGHSRLVAGGLQVDLADSAVVARVFREHSITAVLHLAAEARTGLCEQRPDLAQSVNVVGLENLLQASAQTDKPLPYFLHVSTDMVFAGNDAPYNEVAARDAVSVYGRSKVQAEELVEGYAGRWAIVRPALIYGAPVGGRVSVLSPTVDAIRSGEGAFFQDEIRTPVWVEDLINLFLLLLESEQVGIFNAGGRDRLSRYEFALKVAQRWGMADKEVRRGLIGDDPQFAWRPKDISLISEKAHGLVQFTNFDETLSRIQAEYSDL